MESCADQLPERTGARDRLLIGGGSVLSDVELLGLVLDAGAGTSAGLELAERLLGVAGCLARLDRLDRRACAPLGRLWPRRLALVRSALELGRRAAAAALILVHNHPSGDPTPSAEDCAITQRLRQAGELVGIRVLDHVVIGRGRWASMAEEGRW